MKIIIKVNKGNLIRFDWAIKRLLRHKANYIILEGFLSELLNDDIKIQEILDSESNKETKDNKYNRVDMLVSNAKGELIIIECQTNRRLDYLMRMLFGTCKVIVDNMDEGKGYNKIKKVISINIVYFDLGHGEDYIYHGTTQYVGIHKKDILSLSPVEQKVYHTEQIAKIYPEYYIIKVNQFNELAISGIDEWVYLFKNSAIKPNFKAKGIKEAAEKLSVLQLTPKQKIEYDNFIKDWRDLESYTVGNFDAGRAEGISEGISIEAKNTDTKINMAILEIATKMKKNGVDTKTISETTNFSIEDIEKI